MFGFLKKLFGGGSDELKQKIDEGATLVDVRTPHEFDSGHVKGSINIPLHVIGAKAKTLQGKKHVIVFCASGMRSGQAKRVLEQHGLTNVSNGGSWHRVQKLVG